MNAPAGLDLASHPGPDPVRGAARDPAQHQGCRIHRIVRAVAGLDAKGRAAQPRHAEPLSLPPDGRRNLPRADPDRDGDHQSRLHPRLVPGQSFIEFLLKRGYDVYMMDWTAPKPEEKSLRMEDYVLDFIPDCIRRVQQDSGETGCLRDRLLLRRRAVAAVRLDLQRRADEEFDLLHHADRFPRDEAVLEFLRPPLFRRRQAGGQRRQRAAAT